MRGWGEENFPCLKLTSQTFGLRGISARSSYFIQVYFLSVLLFSLYFFLFTLTFLLLLLLLLFHCFISYFFLFAANFNVFLLISALEQRGGFFWVEGRGKGVGGKLDSLRPIPNERNFS